MIAFISSTPHQTWNAIVMAKKLFSEERCDLYLIDDCADYLETIDLLNKESVFEDVIPCTVQDLYCNKYKNPIIRKIRRTLYFICWRGYLKKNAPIKAKKYSKVFISLHDEIRCFMLTKIKKNNPEVEAMYYEDGIVDYLHDAYGIHHGIKVQIAKIVGLDYSVGHNIKKSYVLSPKCVMKANVEFLQIPIIDKEKDTELISMLNRVFHYRPYSINEKIVYLFQQLRSISTELESAICSVASEYGYDNLILKDHPRLPAEGYKDIKRIPKKHETLWECMCANVDYSNKILISHCSTALYTPKFVFDQEPVLIFLFDLYRDAMLEHSGERISIGHFVDKLRDTYRNKDRVFVPQTEEELFDYLKKVMKQSGQS